MISLLFSHSSFKELGDLLPWIEICVVLMMRGDGEKYKERWKKMRRRTNWRMEIQVAKAEMMENEKCSGREAGLTCLSSLQGIEFSDVETEKVRLALLSTVFLASSFIRVYSDQRQFSSGKTFFPSTFEALHLPTEGGREKRRGKNGKEKRWVEIPVSQSFVRLSNFSGKSLTLFQISESGVVEKKVSWDDEEYKSRIGTKMVRWEATSWRDRRRIGMGMKEEEEWKEWRCWKWNQKIKILVWNKGEKQERKRWHYVPNLDKVTVREMAEEE